MVMQNGEAAVDEVSVTVTFSSVIRVRVQVVVTGSATESVSPVESPS